MIRGLEAETIPPAAKNTSDAGIVIPRVSKIVPATDINTTQADNTAFMGRAFFHSIRPREVLTKMFPRGIIIIT